MPLTPYRAVILAAARPQSSALPLRSDAGCLPRKSLYSDLQLHFDPEYNTPPGNTFLTPNSFSVCNSTSCALTVITALSFAETVVAAVVRLVLVPAGGEGEGCEASSHFLLSRLNQLFLSFSYLRAS